MKNKLKSPVGLNAMGIGPKIFRNTLPFLLVAILLGIFLPDIFVFPISIKTDLKYIGCVMLTAGILLYFITIAHFLRNFSKGILITDGIFALSRNPLYGSWILLIMPAIGLVADNWSFLFPAVAMYVFFVLNISQEEENLQRIFGEQYTEYCKKVNRILFFPKF